MPCVEGRRPAATAAAGAAPDAYPDERGTRVPGELYSGRRQNRLFCAPRERPDSLSARSPYSAGSLLSGRTVTYGDSRQSQPSRDIRRSARQPGASALICGAALTGVLSFRVISPARCVPGGPPVHADGIAGFPASASPGFRAAIFPADRWQVPPSGPCAPQVVVEKARPDRPGGGRGWSAAPVRSVAWM